MRRFEGIRSLPNVALAPNTTFQGGVNSAILRYLGAPATDPTTQQTNSTQPLVETNLHVSGTRSLVVAMLILSSPTAVYTFDSGTLVLALFNFVTHAQRYRYIARKTIPWRSGREH